MARSKPSKPRRGQKPVPERPLTTRSALILLLAVLSGTCVGVLLAVGGKSVPEAVVAGLFAVGGSATAFNALIGG